MNETSNPEVPPSSVAIISTLDSIDDPEGEASLATLQSTLAALEQAPDADRCIGALFAIFERFPWSDGFESFWSILHALERLPGSERALVASVRRAPGEFNLLMVKRCLNGGITEVDGVSLLPLLQEVVASPAYSERARREAERFAMIHLEEIAPSSG